MSFIDYFGEITDPRKEAKQSIFQYIEGYYKCILLLTIKRHLSLSMLAKSQKGVSTKVREDQAMWSDNFRHEIIFGHETAKV